MPQIVSEPMPCCHTSTITPHAAATESRFSITAFSGSTASGRRARAGGTSGGDQRDDEPRSCRRRHRRSRRSAPPPATDPAQASVRMRSSVARPSPELAVAGDDGDQRRAVAPPAAGAAACTPSTGEPWRGRRRPRQGLERRQRPRRRPAPLELLEPARAGSRLRERLRARIAELDRERGAASASSPRPTRSRRPSGGAPRAAPTRSTAPPRARPALRGQSSRGPIVASTTGSSVSATATLTSGIQAGDPDAAQEREAG